MALSDQSFQFYTDSGLTILFSGALQLAHKTDFTDNPQDTQLFYGSNTANRKIETTVAPGVNNVEVTPVVLRAEWVTVTVYSLGTSIEPTTPNGFRYVVTTAGTSDVSEPTFPTAAIGDTVLDGTVVWTLTAEAHAITEFKLALTAGGLSAATPGAALSLGVTVLSGVGNAVEVNVRVINAVPTVNNNAGFPGIGLQFVDSITEKSQ